MNFCSHCGSNQVLFRIPDGDNRERYVCSNCGHIHYQNPRMICGSIVTHEDKIMLCRRAIEPQKGLWTLPAGFMENGETTTAAAHRETWEEALAEIESDQLYCIFNLPHISQVYFFYLGKLKNNAFGEGEETLETKFFYLDEIPWEQLAFKTVSRALKLYQQDLDAGHFPFRMEDIIVEQKA